MKNNFKYQILKTISHEETDRVPYYLNFTPPALYAAEKYYGSPLEDKLNFPIRETSCESIKPLYANPLDFGKRGIDEFGVMWTTSEIDRGVPVGPSIRTPDLTGFVFPDCNAPYRFKNMHDWSLKNKEYFKIIWVGDLFERACFMRGTENLLIDLYHTPKFAEKLLDELTQYILGTMKVLFSRFEFDCIAVSDDYGAQKSMLISPVLWRKFIKPKLVEIYDLAKRNNMKILHHSDGDIYEIIKDLIDIGCDILHPVQPEAMDIFKLKREFGKDLTFCGGIRTQDLLVNGSPKEIRDEIKNLKDKLGKGGGFIISTGLTVQADVPAKNILALIEEIKNNVY